MASTVSWGPFSASTAAFCAIEQGAAVEDDHAAPFLKSVLRMLGIPNLHMIAAEGLDIQGFDAEGAMETARRKAEQLAQEL